MSTPSFPFGSSVIKKMMTGQVAFTDIASDTLKNFPNEKVKMENIIFVGLPIFVGLSNIEKEIVNYYSRL